MKRLRHAYRDWPKWAQISGVVLGLWQIAEWKLGGAEPNAGVMAFAGSLVLLERAASARQRKDDTQ